MLFVICIDTAVVGAWVRFLFLQLNVEDSRLLGIYLGTYDIPRLCTNGQAIQHVIQCSQRRTGIRYLGHRHIMFLHQLDGRDLGPTTSIPPRQSASFH